MWYKPNNESSIATPAVLVYPDRIEENILRMIAIAGDAGRLRPHVKTHKISEVITLHLKHGIERFKCATLSEVEMVAGAGGKDILLAYPLLGPGIDHYFRIMEQFPGVKMAVNTDSFTACEILAEKASLAGKKVDLFVDIDNGMRRTGIEPEDAGLLIEFILDTPGLSFRGLHVYDGHIHDQDLKKRRARCDRDFERVNRLVNVLEQKGVQVGEMACGGTPTFPIHAEYGARTLCPGTPVFWDAGYAVEFPDLQFLNAAVVAGRVISKPGGNLCIDLGHKSVASEMTHPRLQFMEMDIADVLNHSEEHLVVSSEKSGALTVGDLVYALPTHVCPTIALHDQVYVVENQQITGTWKVVARRRIHMND